MGKSNIQILVESGADAQDNMWAAKFYWPFDETVGAADLVWRIEGFDIPEAKVKTYKKTFLGVEYTKTASGMDLSREFTLTLTMDATYAIYNRFLTWQKAKIRIFATYDHGRMYKRRPFVPRKITRQLYHGQKNSRDAADETVHRDETQASRCDNAFPCRRLLRDIQR